MKKIISVILCAVLALGVFIIPQTALAAGYWTDGLTANPAATFDGGSGTEVAPYIINSETALAQLAVNVNSGITYQDEDGEKYFRLDKNLDLTGSLWMPIGIYEIAGVSQNKSFKGTFDGNNYVISNLTVNEPSFEGVGLFGYTRDALIENLGVQNCNITGEGVAGGLVGYARTDSSVYRCYTTGSVRIAENDGYFASYNGAFAGGLVGLYGDAPSTIDGCYSSADVDGDDSVGGLVGAVDNARVINSYATGNIGSPASNAYPAGGFVGFCEQAQIEKCYATGNVTGQNELGGFVGSTSGNDSSVITNCYAYGNVTSTFDWGYGLGSFAGYLTNISISNCYSAGTLSYHTHPDSCRIGGFAGGVEFDWSIVEFNNCFFDLDLAARDDIGIGADDGSSPQAGITGLTTANMQGADTLTSANKMDALDSGAGAPVSGTAIWYPHSTDYPDFKVETCTVTYDSQGADTTASPASQSVKLGEVVGTLPSNPVKSNHNFGGWYTAVNGGGAAFTSSSAVTCSITVYAKWIAPPTLTSSVSDGKIYRKGRITLTPSIPGGTWSYDSTFLSLSGNTFTGLKAGTSRVTYTVNGQSVSYDISISKTTLPNTGQDFTWVWILCSIAVITVASGFGILKLKRR